VGHRPRIPRCPTCGYDITGLPHDHCPECGVPFDRDEVDRIANRGLLARIFCNNFTRWHALALAIVWLAFTAWINRITDGNLDQGPDHASKVWLATAFSFIGPFNGAMIRDWQGCCLRFSLEVFPYAAAMLGLGILVMFLRLPRGWIAATVRMFLWILGLSAWFLGAIISYFHALS